MEDFAGIIVFFVIIGLIEKFSKGAKKNRNAQSEPAQKKPVQRVPAAVKNAAAQPAKTAAKPVGAAARPASSEGIGTPEIQRAIQAARQAKAQAAKAIKAKEKTSIEKAVEARAAVDPEGCIGGSIAHTQHEGESKAEHDEHMLRTALPAAQAVQPAVSVQQLRTADLRKAVIMSEILDKPVSMRGRKAV